MPRDGSGIYSIPPGTQGIPDTTIESAKYNAYIADIEVDLNAPRPVIAGGTGATSAAQARDNLDAERSMQTITNFDADPLEVGSFFAAAGAIGAPVAGHAFSGIIYGPDANNMVIEARDLSDTATPGLLWVREKAAGVWSPTWTSDGSDKVSRAGDTMTGNLLIQKVSPVLQLDRTDAGPTAIQGLRGGLTRWQIVPGDNIAEAGANVGSNFLIARSNDAGVQIDVPFSIDRATGIIDANGLVNYAKAQALTEAQKTQARTNIYAAPRDAFGWQNLLVNGSFDVLQQYGLNGSVTVAAGTSNFVADQWAAVADGGGVTLGAAVSSYQVAGALGVTKMLGMTVNGNGVISTATSSFQIYQSIEGQRAMRLNWGTGTGVPVTICFMIFATIAGTAVLTVRNGGATRSYCTPITINNPGAFEWKTVTIPPDSNSSGWWNDARAGLYLNLSFGVGTTYQSPTPSAWVNGLFFGLPGGTNFFAANGNTIRLLAVGMYPGTVAPADAYQYANTLREFADEVHLSKRYWQKLGDGSAAIVMRGTAPGAGELFCETTGFSEMRAAPAVTEIGSIFKSNISGTQVFTTPREATIQLTAAAAGSINLVTNSGAYFALNARI